MTRRKLTIYPQDWALKMMRESAKEAGFPLATYVLGLAIAQERYLRYARSRRDRGYTKDPRVWRIGMRGGDIDAKVREYLERDPSAGAQRITNAIVGTAPRIDPARRRVEKRVKEILGEK